jgi:hypothetical protein
VTERLSNLEVENASSFKDEAEGFEKSLLSKVIRLETGEEPEGLFDGTRQRSSTCFILFG